MSTLSRVGRVAADVLTLLDDKKLKVVFADSPTASRLENSVRAVFAEEEGRAISERTRAALAAARARGTKLGNYDGGRALCAYIAKHGNVKGCEGARKHADEFADSIRDVIAPMIEDGMTEAAIVESLNAEGIEARRGGRWHVTSLRNLCKRLAIRSDRDTVTVGRAERSPFFARDPGPIGPGPMYHFCRARPVRTDCAECFVSRSPNY